MSSAAGAVCIAGAATLTINVREVQYLRNQNDASANTLLPPLFFVVVEVVEVGSLALGGERRLEDKA